MNFDIFPKARDIMDIGESPILSICLINMELDGYADSPVIMS